MPDTADRVLTLTARIVAAYVGTNVIDPGEAPGLIRAIWWSLAELDPRRGVESVGSG